MRATQQIPLKRQHRAAARPDGQAFAFASAVHASQTRKGSAIPYLSHLMGVASLVLEHGGDEDTAIAALLHDLRNVGVAVFGRFVQRWGPDQPSPKAALIRG